MTQNNLVDYHVYKYTKIESYSLQCTSITLVCAPIRTLHTTLQSGILTLGLKDSPHTRVAVPY